MGPEHHGQRRRWIDRRLERDLYRRKNPLAGEYRAELRSEGLEHEIRYARLQERRVDVVANLYEKLVLAQSGIGAFIHPLQEGGAEAQQERGKIAAERGNDFSEYFSVNRIWLEQELCDDIDALNQKMVDAFNKFTEQPVDSPDRRGHGDWHKVWKSVSDDIPPLRREIEDRFRIVLGVDREVAKPRPHWWNPPKA